MGNKWKITGIFIPTLFLFLLLVNAADKWAVDFAIDMLYNSDEKKLLVEKYGNPQFKDLGTLTDPELELRFDDPASVAYITYYTSYASPFPFHTTITSNFLYLDHQILECVYENEDRLQLTDKHQIIDFLKSQDCFKN